MSLSLVEKIGQLFFVGLPRNEINKETRDFLSEIKPGGICLFSRNIRSAVQTRNFINVIYEVLPTSPLISIDQEGGLVDRLRRIVTQMPAAISIKSVSDAEVLAQITGEILLMLGFNMNFAPVVDVIENNAEANYANGLYSRIFGNSEETVQIAGAYLRSLQKSGCLGCVKHFPGLGASEIDSHEELPSVSVTRQELFDTALRPYRELFTSNDVRAVMVAHATYPLIDLQETGVSGKLLPSSLSFNIVNNLLRDELGFQGLVISDDLEMGAILKNYSIGESCVMAINAGVDMLSICAGADNIRNGFTAVVEAVRNGEIKEDRINESLKRIAFVKSLTHLPLPLDSARLQILSQEIAELNTKVGYMYGG